MSITVAGANPIPWWKEPSKDQWLAWIAAWLGWTLDSFDFTIFLLLMVPIAKDFGVPLTEVAVVFTLTLWMRICTGKRCTTIRTMQRSDLSQAVLSRPLRTDRWVSLAHPFQAICEIEQLLLDLRNWCLPS